MGNERIVGIQREKESRERRRIEREGEQRGRRRDWKVEEHETEERDEEAGERGEWLRVKRREAKLGEEKRREEKLI